MVIVLEWFLQYGLTIQSFDQKNDARWIVALGVTRELVSPRTAIQRAFSIYRRG